MLQELEKINKEVERLAMEENRKYYFGRFFPATKVMFVAERPTVPRNKDGWSPKDNFYVSKSDFRFVELLNKYGFGGSYITDVVKSTDISARPSKADVEKYMPILRKELQLLQPKFIVALGDSAFISLTENIDGYQIKKIWHPAYVQRYNRWTEYEKQIKSLLASSVQTTST